MNYLYYKTNPYSHSTYVELEGQLKFLVAKEFRKSVADLINSNKDLYIDIKALESIDLIGLNCLLALKTIVNSLGGDFYLLLNKNNPIYDMLEEIKFKDQLSFRDSLIVGSALHMAS